MTPRKCAENTDAEVLRDILRRGVLLDMPSRERDAIIKEGSAAELVALANQINEKRARARLENRGHRPLIKHGLVD